SHNDGKLQLKLEGTPLINVGLGSTYPTYQLPPQFRALMSNPNFRNAVRIDYDLPPTLLVGPRRTGSITGSNLNIDPNTGIIYGQAPRLASLSLASRITYTLTLDLNALTAGGILPESDQPGRHEYNFRSAVGSGIINV
ncbi:hypothetical protein, partial [Staphylococcus xylosus]